MVELLTSASEKAREAFGFAGSELPVDLGLLCENLGYELYCEPYHPAIDGFAFVTHDGVGHIIVNKTKGLSRRRFTIAHEIGHLVLGEQYGLIGEWLSPNQKCAKRPLETACNVFAAELLMPPDIIRACWHDLRSNPQYRVCIIADRCGVSRPALEVQLDMLGLAKERDRNGARVQTLW